MSALDDVINYRQTKSLSEWMRTFDAATAELAQLRADYEYSLDASEKLILRVTEQARQLDEAREMLLVLKHRAEVRSHDTSSIFMIDAWLAANPAPRVDDQDAADRFNDWRKEREEDFTRRIEAAS